MSCAKYLLGVLFIFATIISSAQSLADQKCGHDWVQHLRAEAHPDYTAELAEYTNRILPQLAQANAAQSRDVLITIPVVVHVIHSGEGVGSGRNLSLSRINSQIQILNEDYRRMNGDANETPSIFQNDAADVEIEFCLAQLDPNGNATNGITRHQYNNIGSIDYVEGTIKPATSWDSDRYLNIWTVDLPSSSIVGYSYLPTVTMVGSIQDGVVINYNNFGFINVNNRGRTATHEVGHYLGLRHPWGDNDNNGDPIGCSSDDGVSDTPTSSGPYYGCPFSGSSCGSTDMFMNYMDYVDDYCMNMFTTGQKNVMQSILLGIRSELADHSEVACNVSSSCVNLAFGDLEMGFENGQSTNGWVIENANNDSRTWTLTTDATDDWGPATGAGHAVYLWNSTTAADDYLFTPCLALTQGHTYELTFVYACAEDEQALYPERFEVGFSQGQNALDFFTVNDDWVFDPVENAYPDFETGGFLFEPSSDLDISLGFHVFSDADQYALQIDDIRIRDLGFNTSSTEAVIVGNHLAIYPNPSSGQFTLDYKFEQMPNELTIVVYDMLGRVIYEAQRPGQREGQENILLDRVQSGIYFVNMKTENGSLSQKLQVYQE